MPVAEVGRGARVSLGTSSPGVGPSAVGESLLRPPSPDLAGLAGVQDALTILYADRVKQGQVDVRSVDTQCMQQQRATEEQQKKLAKAIAEQRAADRASTGFWADLKKVGSTVAKIASVVAGAAAVVMSGGAGAPFVLGVAALVLSSGGMAVRELKLLGKDSESVGMGMELAGAAAGVGSCVAGALKVGATASSATATAGASTATRTTMQTVKTGAQITGAVGTATSATAGVVLASYAEKSELAAADAAEARGAIDTHQRERKIAIETLQAAEEAQRDALSGTIDAISACNNAATVAIAGVRG